LVNLINKNYFFLVSFSLTKDFQKRPKHKELLGHPFLKNVNNDDFDAAEFISSILE